MDDKIFATPRGVLGKRPRIGSSGSNGGNSSVPGNSGRVNISKRINPFEKDLINKLHLPVWSPSVMQCQIDTPPQNDWTINHISMLNPSNIEESPSTHQIMETLEPEVEDKAQADIKHFFENLHVPSPTPESISHADTNMDKCVSTDISFPVDLPSHVMEFLYSYCHSSSRIRTNEENLIEDLETQNLLNNSSVLRRKLDFSFDQPDESMLRSDESDIEERRCHGALIMSP
ncbi:unnamed protein product [Allacma fusca]|uniref:Protein aurora borealis n=1 Tax=Allacma fusca TaxID=39272 RepID=A0A8J2JW59_9HEXA|nr:unnamed protein product [Allacma fusca]